MIGEFGDRWRVDDAEGGEPDYRFSLANERTFLAWIRTALGLLAGGVAAREFADGDIAWLRTALALTAVATSIVLAIGAYLHWVAVQRAVRRGEPLPRTRLVPFIGLLVVLLALLAAAAIVTS